MLGRDHWLRRNWSTPAILGTIFLVALYLRLYFPWELAIGSGLVSGGSDAFYYHRIIEYITETGRQLVFDPLLNSPTGLTNPRPPLYAWVVVVSGKAVWPLFGSVEESVKVAFLSSTAVWGALTIFPMYFLTKEAFGRRAALLAAFFLAVLPAHLQRSPATNGDHDAMVLFFVVVGFFFFLKSLKTLNERRWVEDWSFWTAKGRASIRAGLGGFFAENRTAMLYAVLAGWSLAAIALTWQGWAYAPVILLVYFLFQILVHRFRNRDPMGILIMFGITMGLALIVAFPWYWSMGQIAVWYDVPLYLFLAAIVLGVVFTVTRDYPWALVVPTVVVVSGISLLVLSFFYPAITNAFVSGAGYFVQTKAFETIAEAQAPLLSQIILSFGVATYFLALFGLLWMAYGITKRPAPDYLFVVVWAIAAIFMAQSAARFIFNASPAFAMVSAWITVLLVEWLRFDEMWKTFRSLGGRRITALRRSIKPRHVIGSLLVVFILITPNVWSAVDASIPFERKAEFDAQVYNALPDFLRPEGYESVSAAGGSFFFGAFGYSLPLEREYFPSAWSWFRQQDSDVHPMEDRPAFLSWWDYGFEAIDEGEHPTVADNFLNGYHLAGNVITAQSEAEAIALFNLRLLEGDFREHRTRFSDAARSVLEEWDIPWAPIEDAFRQPQAYVSVVTSDPVTYGRYDTLQPLNAQYIYGEEILTSRLDAHQLAELNHALRKIVGSSIRYFAVDARLFPVDGRNTGIFYAPAKLSDQRITELRDGRSIPRDFFTVIAATQRGNIPIEDVRPTDSVTDLLIQYEDMFYNSMFYRAYVGIAPRVAGQDCNDCVPGLPSPTNRAIQNVPPMQAWNLSHFRVVYKTAYYNPFPQDQIQNHTDAWRALDYTEAQELQGKINRGEATGIVDLSPGSLIRRGVVFVKYYDGAFVNGTVTLGGSPWPGVRLTVQDELGIPHHTTVTDADGRYSLIVPFGDLSVIASVGAMNNVTMVGSTNLRTVEVTVSDAASMRENVDEDGDGILDWLLTRNIDLDAEALEGTVYLDTDRDATFDLGEPRLGNADLTVLHTGFPLLRTGRTAADGTVRVEGLYPGQYLAALEWQGRTLALANVTITANQAETNVPVTPEAIEGYVRHPDGRPVAGATVSLRDLTNGTTLRAQTAEDGFFVFPAVLAGSFESTASAGNLRALPARADVATGVDRQFHNVTVYPSGTVSIRTALGGATQGFVTLDLERRTSDRPVLIVTTNAAGTAQVDLPEGTWDVHSRHYVGTTLWALVGTLTVTAGGTSSYTASLVAGAAVGGLIYNAANRTDTLGAATIVFKGPAGQHRILSDFAGKFLTHLPRGTWTIQVSHRDFAFLEPRTIAGDATLDLPVPRGVRVEGTVLRDLAGNFTLDIDEPVVDALLRFSDGTRTFETLTNADGKFEVALPAQGQFSLTLTRAGYDALTFPPASASLWNAQPGIEMTASNITVSGTVRRDGTPVADSGLRVRFQALGLGAVDTQAVPDSTGRYAVDLQPGSYEVVVDEDVSGTGDVRLQLRRETALAPAVGSAAVALDLDVVLRSQVNGTLSLGGQPRSTIVRFEGPDIAETNATDGEFSLFLADGTYTVIANLTEGADTYLALETVSVAGPGVVAVTLQRATNVTGTVRHAGSAIADAALTFTRQDGAVARATSDAFGQYHTFLLGGSYRATVDHPGTTAAGAGVRYVRYTFGGDLTVVQDTRILVYNFDVDQVLNNATVSGTVRYAGAPVPARLTFLVQGANGINATATAAADGTFSLSMQPGAYDVYAVDTQNRGAFLGPLQLSSVEPLTFDVTLRDAVRVSGTTFLGSARIVATLTFTGAAARMTTASSTVGTYEVYLPAGPYNVDASSTGTERGVAVSYHAIEILDVEETTVLNLQLEKVVHHAADLVWDSAQRATIAAGGIVDYTITIRNTGNEDNTITLTAAGTGFSFTFSKDRITLPFGVENEATVRVTITAAPDARVDHPAITVTARTEGEAAALDSVILDVDIIRFRGLDADVSTEAPTWDGRFLNYTIEVQNRGNGADAFRLTLPNLDELQSAGWSAVLVGPGGETGPSLGVLVTANSTQTVTLRLGNAGGTSGTLARIHVVNEAEPRFESLVTVNVQMPLLAIDGIIRASGPGITVQEPGIDLATTAFLVSIVALLGAVVYLAWLRRRQR